MKTLVDYVDNTYTHIYLNIENKKGGFNISNDIPFQFKFVYIYGLKYILLLGRL